MTPLPSWERPHFAACDGAAFLYFVAFGAIDTNRPLSASTYRCAGIPDDFQVTAYDRPTYPEVFERFLRGSVHKVSADREDAIARMIERFIEYQTLGGVIPEGQPIRMAGLPPGGVARHGGSLEDFDFNNVHVEIVWPDFAAPAN